MATLPSLKKLSDLPTYSNSSPNSGTMLYTESGVDYKLPINTVALTSDLASVDTGKGTALLGYQAPRYSNTHATTLLDVLANKLCLFDFIPPELHSGIRDYSYTGDLSNYVQNAIDTANAMGGAIIECPPGQYYLNVKTKQYVILMGARANTVRRAMPWTYGNNVTPFTTRFRNYSTDWVISAASTSQSDVSSRSFGLIGIDVDAKDSVNSTGGVLLRGPEICVKSCSFYGFQDQGLEVSGNIALIEDVIANECLKNRVRTDYVGTIEISGASDCQIHRIEGNAQVTGLNSITNSAPYICGIKIVGNNHYVSGLMGEISETGVYVSSSSVHHKVINSRADNNVGPGYLMGGVIVDNCHAYNNSRSGDGLYPGFGAAPGATRIMLSNCLAWTDGFPVDGTATQRNHSYGFDFATVDYLSLRLKPWLNQCYSYGHSINWVNIPPTYGIQYTPTNGILSVTNNTTTTPNVDGVNIVRIATTALTQITGFVGGMVGQTVDVYLDATTTITFINSSSFLVNNYAKNADKVLTVGRVYKFIKTADTIWREVGDAPRVYSGSTSSRPSSTAVTGMQYYDTDIDRPVYRNAANTTWIVPTPQVPSWSLTGVYSTGDMVKYSDGYLYVANGAIPTNTAWTLGLSGATWRPVSNTIRPYVSGMYCSVGDPVISGNYIYLYTGVAGIINSAPVMGSLWRPLTPGASVKIKATATQTTTTGTNTALTWTSATTEYNSSSIYTVATAGITVPVAGIYRIAGRVAFASNNTGTRSAGVFINGSYYAGSQARFVAKSGGYATTADYNDTLSLAAGSIITLSGFQDSGGNLDTVATAPDVSFLIVSLVSYV